MEIPRRILWRGFDSVPRRAVLGDGAKSIWNLATEYLPRRDPDCRPLSRQAARLGPRQVIYGAGTDLGKQWAHERYVELDVGDFEASLHNLRPHTPKD